MNRLVLYQVQQSTLYNIRVGMNERSGEREIRLSRDTRLCVYQRVPRHFLSLAASATS